MESDQWNAKDFSDNDTRLLNQILSSSTRDPPAWTESSKIWILYSDMDEEADGIDELAAAQASQTNRTGAAKARVEALKLKKRPIFFQTQLCCA